MKKYIIIVAVGLLSLGGLYLLGVRESSSKPGQVIPDMGRDHVADSVKVDYNSNPPTSGPHNSDWEKPGIYSEPLNDRKLIHSLEHGYIIISYNCDYKKQSNLNLPFINPVIAHTDESGNLLEEATPSTESNHLDLSAWKDNSDCQKLVADLTNLANQKKVWKLIVIPRPNLDNRIALTAWARLDKFYDFDEKRITAFIDAYRNRGPEKTME